MVQEFNGLTFQEFDRCLKECESLWTANDKIYAILKDHADQYGEHAEFFLPLQSTSVIRLLSLLTHDKSDWISYWCYELNFGKDAIADSVTELDGTPIPMYSTEDLWNVLVQNAQKEE